MCAVKLRALAAGTQELARSGQAAFLASKTMRPKLKVWIVFGERVKFGDGRAQLFELINELGSLKKAVGRLGMSYRSAWGYIRELEQAAGFKFLARKPGGGPRSGTRLTKEGKRFLYRYWRFRQGLDDVVSRHFARSFKHESKIQEQ